MTPDTAPPEAVATPEPRFPQVVVFGDFICPWSYLGVRSALRLAAAYAVAPVWRPHWLRPDIPPAGASLEESPRRVATEAWIRDVAPDAAARMRHPDRIHFSFRAFEALEFAEVHGLGLAFAAEVFDALWVRGEDIGRTGPLLDAAERAGLDVRRLEQRLARHADAGRALEAVNAARRIGITATPTFIIGSTRVDGWHYDEVLEQVLRRQGAQRLGEGHPSAASRGAPVGPTPGPDDGRARSVGGDVGSRPPGRERSGPAQAPGI